MSVLELSSLTDFLLSAEALFAAGVVFGRTPRRPSAAFFWALSLLALGIGALLGGIDHGFFETHGLPRAVVQKATWVFLGALAFFALLTAGWQFTAPRTRTVIMVIGLCQLGAFLAVSAAIGDSVVLVIETAPALILFLVLSLRSGGSWQMAAGLLLCIGAPVLSAVVGDALSPVDRYGLYHLGIIAAVPFLAAGGVRLKA
jgi:hypothetical protein